MSGRTRKNRIWPWIAFGAVVGSAVPVMVFLTRGQLFEYESALGWVSYYVAFGVVDWLFDKVFHPHGGHASLLQLVVLMVSRIGFWALIGGLTSGFIVFVARISRSRADNVLAAPACPSCGYCLTGLTVARCPECGKPFDFTLLDSPNSATMDRDE